MQIRTCTATPPEITCVVQVMKALCTLGICGKGMMVEDPLTINYRYSGTVTICMAFHIGSVPDLTSYWISNWIHTMQAWFFSLGMN